MAVVLSLAATAMGRAAGGPWQARVFRDSTGFALPYRMLLPAGESASRPCPLVLYLHGKGERGSDNGAQLRNGASELFLANGHPCFVVAPQCPDGEMWVGVDHSTEVHVQSERPSRPLAAVLELVETLRRDLRVDPDRCYVMGISMGGFGTWELLARRPDLFAAGIPICGGGDVKMAPRLVSLPIWAFHGRDDTVVKVGRSRSMVSAVEAAGGRPRYTEYPGVGHDSWVRAFAEPGLLDWLFSQHRPAPAP